MSFGLGVGYQMNDWLRLDFTGEYRGGSKFHALDQFNNAGMINTNDYTFTKKEWLFLANAYLDLGTWWCITPFIGAGVGFTNLTIGNYRDNNDIAGGGGWAKDETRDQFRLGAACRRVLQGHAEFRDRIELSLSQSWRRQVRRHHQFRRHQPRQQPDDGQGHHLA